MTFGAVDRLEKGRPDGLLEPLHKSGEYHSLVRTMMRKGYTRSQIKGMLLLTEEELTDLLKV